MNLANPQYAGLYTAVAGLAALLWWAGRRRQRLLQVFAAAELVPRILVSVNDRRRRARAVLLVAGTLFLVTAITGPRWGFRWTEVKRRGVDIIIVLDTSRSMLAPDIKPSRMNRARLAAGDLVGQLEGDRIGLVAFAGTAFLQCPLTLDYGAFSVMLEQATTTLLPRGGTAIARAIEEGTAGFERSESKHKALILITDGESHEGDAVQAARDASAKGVTIYAIGVGTPDGELIPAGDGAGDGGFLKDADGHVVKSQLDEKLLQRIAMETGGAYVRATPTRFGLAELYEKRIVKMEKKELESELQKRFEERYQIPLVLGLAAVFLEAVLEERRRRL